MKISLVWGVYNKAPTLAGVLSSWLVNLSGQHTVEAIVVCDACTDGSQEIARETLTCFTPPLSRWQVLEAPDVYEIACNNMALNAASDDSDLIVFIQDDNTLFDRHWDTTLITARRLVERPGATALLAGGLFHPDGVGYDRVEARRPHKGAYFEALHTIYLPGVYQVDFVTRPFAVSTPLLRSLGGLGAPGYDVICWDDTDLSAKLLKAGYQNQYVSLDVLNLCSGQETMKERMAQSFQHNHAIFNRTHQAWLAARARNEYARLAPLYVHKQGAQIVHPVYDL